MLELGDRIKYLREKLDWTQQQLSDKTGLTKVQLSRYETNDRKPDPDALKRIADALDTSGDYLLGRTDDPNPANADSGRAYRDGGKGWTQDEIQAADEFIQMLRRRDAEKQRDK